MKSLIGTAEEPRKERLEQLRVVTTRLDRQSLDQPWGLGFVSINHSNLGQQAAYNYNANGIHDATTTSLLFGRRVIVVNSSVSVTKHEISPQDQEIGIRAGDIILEVDGRSLSSWSTNGNASNGNMNIQNHLGDGSNHNSPNRKDDNITSEIASHLRSIYSVSIVVLRHAEIVQAAAIAAFSNVASVTTEGDPKHCKHDPYRISSIANAAWNQLLLPRSFITSLHHEVHAQKFSRKRKKAKAKVVRNDVFVVYRNPWFWEENEKGVRVNIPYSDNEGTSLDYELYMQEDGTRAGLFLPPIPSTRVDFCEWLSKRKRTWRSRYKVYAYADYTKSKKKACEPKEISSRPTDDDSNYVGRDFWSHQGFASFQEWLRNRSNEWLRAYSWNKRKRQRIQQECFERVVVLPPTFLGGSSSPTTSNHPSTGSCSSEDFYEWLKARRIQWRMSRRKRKRQRQWIEGTLEGTSVNYEHLHSTTQALPAPGDIDDVSSSLNHGNSPQCVASFTSQKENIQIGNKPTKAKRKLQFWSKEDQEMALIDDILEEKEKEKEEYLRMRAKRPPIDIVRFFDATQGIPDDVVAHCFSYIDPREHAKLLAINRTISKSVKDRHGVWQMLCPSHWILPRRPRKPWHEIYLTRFRKEREQHRKRWDDLLVKCSNALFKRDDLQKVEKLIAHAETDFGFDLNYSSGVVCERNSVLNLAVIHGRYKIVRWLVDTKHADIETSDRGNFTPLLNAAWSGDRWLVRFFLQRRADRHVRGTQHYTQGIAPPGFEGKTAEEWAQHKGHPEIAKLIRLGL